MPPGSTASLLPLSTFISTTATIQIATSVDNNLVISTPRLPLVSTQSTMILQSPFTSQASPSTSSVLGLPSQLPTPTSAALSDSILSSSFTVGFQPSTAPSEVSTTNVQPTVFTSAVSLQPSISPSELFSRGASLTMSPSNFNTFSFAAVLSEAKVVQTVMVIITLSQILLVQCSKL